MPGWFILPPEITSPFFLQGYIRPQNAGSIIALESVCSATERLPSSAAPSTGVEDSGGAADIWQIEYRGTQVVIRTFRIHPTQKAQEAKEVCIQSAWEARSRAKSIDRVEACACVEEAIP